MNFRLFLLTVFLPIMLAAACQAGPAPKDAQDDHAGNSIGEGADPDVIAELPISTRSFEMGTAGFIPRHYPNSSQDDWRDLFEHDAASYGEIYGVHIDPAGKVNEDGILEQAQLAFKQVRDVEPYIAFSVNYEDGPFTHERGEELKRAAVAIAKKYQPKYISLGVESNSFYLFQQETFDLYVRMPRKPTTKSRQSVQIPWL